MNTRKTRGLPACRWTRMIVAPWHVWAMAGNSTGPLFVWQHHVLSHCSSDNAVYVLWLHMATQNGQSNERQWAEPASGPVLIHPQGRWNKSTEFASLLIQHSDQEVLDRWHHHYQPIRTLLWHANDLISQQCGASKPGGRFTSASSTVFVWCPECFWTCCWQTQIISL